MHQGLSESIPSWSHNAEACPLDHARIRRRVEQRGGRRPGGATRTDATRIALHNQIWLSKKAHGFHLDLSAGVVRSAVLDSGRSLWGTHAEIGVGIGGWATLFAGGDFLDRDARVMLGMRAHGIGAGPLIALALAGMAIGGAL